MEQTLINSNYYIFVSVANTMPHANFVYKMVFNAVIISMLAYKTKNFRK